MRVGGGTNVEKVDDTCYDILDAEVEGAPDLGQMAKYKISHFQARAVENMNVLIRKEVIAKYDKA